MSPDLVSVVLRLRANQIIPLPAVEPGTHPVPQAAYGRAAQALFFEALGRADPNLVNEIHNSSGLKPFTVSDLLGHSPSQGVQPELVYGVRYTALTRPVAEILLKAIEPGGRLGVGTSVRLHQGEFRVEAVALDAAASPWAAVTSYETLSAPWLLGRATPNPRLGFQLSSPTTFKSQERHVPVPMPAWVFGSLLEKWNAFAPVALPPEARRFAEECLALTRYRLQTRMMPVKEGGLRAGAVGTVSFTVLNKDRYWLSVMNLLADFAVFAGIGAGTTMGLGQARRL
jgi:CRISPR-associated endoribonuclease Cas6